MYIIYFGKNESNLSIKQHNYVQVQIAYTISAICFRQWNIYYDDIEPQ